MRIYFLIFIFTFLTFKEIKCADLPTVYEYYTSGGIHSGLKAEGEDFTLNGKKIRILSGSLHYFRVVPEYWKDRLLKMKAAGLNAVQIYLPWNAHEEHPGQFNFNGILDLEKFLKEIKEADMFAIVRPGPYICAEWEFGGQPAWLLRDPHMNLRTNYSGYMKAAERFFHKSISIVKDQQFSVNGGPIIAVAVENEYSSYGNTERNSGDKAYVTFLRDVLVSSGIKELLFSSDNGAKTFGSIPGLLITINFGGGAKNILQQLKHLQPNRPRYVAEFWSGWFDHWGEKHHTTDIGFYQGEYQDILLTTNSSANIYMFHGGTNFGFMNGANAPYKPTVTSYDYSAPLSEAGDYTDKYWKTKEIIEKLQKERNVQKFKTPQPPPVSKKGAYGKVKVNDFIPFETILSMVTPVDSHDPVHMEMLNIGSDYGQNYGWTLYRSNIQKSEYIKLEGGASDRSVIFVDSKSVATLEFNHKEKNPTVKITPDYFNTHLSDHTLDILVENMGRINYGWEMNNERKGIHGKVLVDNKEQNKWKIYPLEFDSKFMDKLKHASWKQSTTHLNPALYRAEFKIDDHPKDTFLKMDHPWKRGVVFVNGFNVGRYFDIGPQKTLYIPAPLLKMGNNQIVIFEVHSAGGEIQFIDTPIL